MKSLVNKEVAEVLEAFEKDPNAYNGSPIKELLMERKDMAVKEKNFAEDMIKIQERIATELAEKAQNLTMLRGQIVYIEGKILEHLKK